MKLYETKFGPANLAMVNFLFKIYLGEEFYKELINDERSE